MKGKVLENILNFYHENNFRAYWTIHIFFDTAYKNYERHDFVDSIILAPQHDDIPSLLITIYDINK